MANHIDYHQPSFYRFNRDSITLAQYIRKNIALEGLYLLEVGAGCGIVACEVLHQKSAHKITLLEIQSDFQETLSHNANNYLSVSHRVVIDDFLQWALKANDQNDFFDLVFFNPPYFFIEDSRASSDEVRDNCRRIKKSHLKKWIELSITLLKERGDLIFCHRSQSLDELLGLHEYQFKKSKGAGDDGCWLYHYSRRL